MKHGPKDYCPCCQQRNDTEDRLKIAMKALLMFAECGFSISAIREVNE